MKQADENSELDLNLFRVWAKATKTLFDNFKRDIESHGISQDHFMILELLYNKGPHPIQRISEIFAIPSGSITYVVDKLEKIGYVRRQPSVTDRRTLNVNLTESGEALFNEVFPKHVATISRNFSFIDNEEKTRMIQLFKRIGLGAQGLREE
ncbi:MarR family transcriptional regulator [Paenibacillus sp. FSL H8-0548]|uniref:MarR family winged helix-turn-helix transcriptional regulator n=1 Tax=Paenibacillus sp. FSL H8-0548 TaxID=1920422 RepID=UPI00096DAD16|nr:MarR family transcriptional regulator [Paenibacillus sp. FSL H8-0548]OMF19719.1 MarR family transcriptional regulator [Paenibacillus sp. FSL H8-0548]